MSLRKLDEHHVWDLVKDFEEKARDREGAALKLDSEDQWELAGTARVQAECFRESAKMAKELEGFAHEQRYH
jgi:formylglycine-generating enzyme required for sulfatase activity